MGQKVHPFGFRLGVFEDWHARWFAKGKYCDELKEDFRVREFLSKRLNNTDIARIVIEKAVDNVRIVIFTSRPGYVIGKKGQGVEQLKADLFNFLKKNVDVSVQEVRVPELSALLVAKSIAEQIGKRVSYKRLMKKSGYAILKSGARGVKICISGRLGGAEIARTEWLRLGSTPLHTLRANIDYAFTEAYTTYGMIGVKVWICKGEYSANR
ncbi:MAG: 30S ribosomal protein S3 [Epsilonproteobacteria bacterium]|nr:30S ribosomal protein S3 [Campylobacterota bacterium]